MRCVIQRVARARVTVADEVVGSIGHGLLVLAGAEAGDSDDDMRYCADKLAGLRIFEDGNDKMNLSVADIGGSVLLVSQFTLLGDARRGRRPSFSDAARPEIAEPMISAMAVYVAGMGIPVQTGVFGADMAVELLNDGPVTILLDSKRRF